MKKLLTSLILSLSILTSIPVSTLAAQTQPTQFALHFNQQYEMICKVKSSIFDPNKNIYYTTLLDENQNEWMLYTTENLTNKWIVAFTLDNQTPNNEYDDIIYDYDYLPDHNIKLALND